MVSSVALQRGRKAGRCVESKLRIAMTMCKFGCLPQEGIAKRKLMTSGGELNFLLLMDSVSILGQQKS